jgi:hypothetical protein
MKAAALRHQRSPNKHVSPAVQELQRISAKRFASDGTVTLRLEDWRDGADGGELDAARPKRH